MVQGLEDGKQQVLGELAILQHRYGAALDQLVDLSRELEAHNRIQIIQLACQVAERLVRHEISVNPIRMFEMVSDALQQIEDADEATVHCSEPDQAFLIERRQDLAATVGAAFRLRIVTDPALEYGDFRIETRIGSVNGLVAQRLADIEDSLMGDGDV